MTLVPRRIYDGNLTLWPPPHGVVGCWSVAVNDVWVHGVYDSEETARAAAGYDDAILRLMDHIWRHDGENRAATMADLRDAIARHEAGERR